MQACLGTNDIMNVLQKRASDKVNRMERKRDREKINIRVAWHNKAKILPHRLKAMCRWFRMRCLLFYVPIKSVYWLKLNGSLKLISSIFWNIWAETTVMWWKSDHECFKRYRVPSLASHIKIIKLLNKFKSFLAFK